MQETGVQSLGGEDPLEKEMATHASILAWRISWTEEPGGLQSMGSQVLDTTEWLSLHFNSGLIPGQGTWFHLLQLRAPMMQHKVLWATPNTQCSQINKQKYFKKSLFFWKKNKVSLLLTAVFTLFWSKCSGWRGDHIKLDSKMWDQKFYREAKGLMHQRGARWAFTSCAPPGLKNGRVHACGQKGLGNCNHREIWEAN